MYNKIKVGFDLGNTSLKIAVHKKGTVTGYEVPLPEHLMEEDTITMPHAFSAFLKKTKKELHLPGGPAGLCLPSSQVICRLVSMPRMTTDQLMLNLPHEFSDFIHGKPHQYHCDYALCEDPAPLPGETDSPELTMMAAAVEKQLVQQYIRMFASGGFSLRLMLPQEMTLIQLTRTLCHSTKHAPAEFCFIDLGYLSTRIFVIHRDRIQATRRISIGCRELAATVADILNIDPFLADAYIRSNHQNILEHPQCIEIYERIAVEALKLINFYHFTYRQNQLGGIYFIGGGAGIQPLCQLLEQTLDLSALPVTSLVPFSQLSATCIHAAGLLAGEKEE